MSVARGIRSEEELDTMAAAVPFAIEQAVKGLWSGMPGIVEKYDAATRRAQVRPAIMGCDTDNRMLKRLPIIDVPVIAPSCGGATITFCLVEGDAVWLSWSMRGITAFLKTHEDAAPDPLSSLMSATDAVCFPRIRAGADRHVHAGLGRGARSGQRDNHTVE